MKTRISALISKASLLLMILAASILMPFNIYADTIDSHIRGRNYTYEPITYTEFEASTTTKYYQNVGVFHIIFELDDEYIGYVLPNYTLQFDNYFYGSSNPNWGTLSKTFNRRVFVNGSSFSFDLTVNWNSITVNTAHSGDTPYFYDSYTFSSSDVTKYADIDSIDQIINILTDLYNSNDQVEGLLNDQLAQLQQVVSNTSLANQYLDTISKIRKYNFPFESFYPNYFMFQSGYEVLDINNYYYWSYPLFKVPSNGMIANHYINNGEYFYLLTIGYSFNNLNAVSVLLDTALTPVSVRTLELYNMPNTDLRLNLVTFRNDNSSGKVPIYNRYTNNLMFIYMGTSDINGVLNVSTDFALRFGLNNKLLNDLDIIAKGTAASNQQSQDLSSGTDSMQDQMDDLVGVEDSYNQQFNDSVNQIDFNNPLQQNAGLLGASNFVITVFNGLIANNPFSILIIIVCILLIGKKVIGK